MTETQMSEQMVRERVRALLAEIHPDDPQVDQVAFRGAQFDCGLAFVHFPEGLGGLGIAPKMQQAVNDELRQNTKTQYRDNVVNLIGIGMAAPTLLTYAAEDQKANYLRPIFTGEEVWCQLFSEPGAGSDVSSLATRAEKQEGIWRITGQKVWTTLAHKARWGMLLARTHPEAPKHKGLTYFILDMQAPGVEVRPLYQITGEAEFNEVFLTDVAVNDHMRLGGEGEGWKVAITTLMNERVAIGSGRSKARRGPVDTLLDLWREKIANHDVSEDYTGRNIVLSDRVSKLAIDAWLSDITSHRANLARRVGNPGPEGSVGKLTVAELNQRIYEACMDIRGSEALVYTTGYEKRRATESFDNLAERAAHRYLRSRANTIEGGTSEIMRNILAERVLGLPGEPRADKDVPWSQSLKVAKQ